MNKYIKLFITFLLFVSTLKLNASFAAYTKINVKLIKIIKVQKHPYIRNLTQLHVKIKIIRILVGNNSRRPNFFKKFLNKNFHTQIDLYKPDLLIRLRKAKLLRMIIRYNYSMWAAREEQRTVIKVRPSFQFIKIIR